MIPRYYQTAANEAAWDEAYEILCQHVTAAAAEIRVLSLREEQDEASYHSV